MKFNLIELECIMYKLDGTFMDGTFMAKSMQSKDSSQRQGTGCKWPKIPRISVMMGKEILTRRKDREERKEKEGKRKGKKKEG